MRISPVFSIKPSLLMVGQSPPRPWLVNLLLALGWSISSMPNAQYQDRSMTGRQSDLPLPRDVREGASGVSGASLKSFFSRGKSPNINKNFRKKRAKRTVKENQSRAGEQGQYGSWAGAVA